jgi:hypothetical protein
VKGHITYNKAYPEPCNIIKICLQFTNIPSEQGLKRTCWWWRQWHEITVMVKSEVNQELWLEKLCCKKLILLPHNKRLDKITILNIQNEIVQGL